MRERGADIPVTEVLAQESEAPPLKHRRQRTYELLSVAREGAILSKVIDLSLIILILLNVAAVMAESMEQTRREHEVFFYWFELFSVAVFSVEYALRIWSCVEDPRRSTMRLGLLNWRLRFVRSAPALFDLMAILPFYLFHLGLLGNLDMRFLRCFRVLRVFKLTRYSQAMTLLLEVLRDNARTFAAALGVLLIVMLFAASGIYLFEREAQPEDFGSIPAAMWWAFATLTTVGYGDVTPITTEGKIFGAMITVVSIGMVALPAGILASSFSEQLGMRKDRYRLVADRAYADGVIDENEREELERMRVDLGLSRETVDKIMAEEYQSVVKRIAENHMHCPRCGHSLDLS